MVGSLVRRLPTTSKSNHYLQAYEYTVYVLYGAALEKPRRAVRLRGLKREKRSSRGRRLRFDINLSA